MEIGYCPCDQCCGRLTGAWEDEEDLSWMDYVPMEYEDPYEGICCSCGMELTPDHVFETCPEPEGWSKFIGPRMISRPFSVA